VEEVVGGKRLGRRSADATERTRRGIVGAAVRLFAERGYEGVSVRDIAREAGTTHGLIRHHFGSKEGVWRVVVEAADAEYVGALRPVLTAGVASDEDARAAFAAIVRGVVVVSARHPEIVRLLVREGVGGGERLRYILEHITPLRRAVAPPFARLRGQGLLRHFDEDTFFLFLVLAGATPFALSALTEGILGTEILTEEYAERYADRIVRTLFSEPGA